ncbi:hypothetical protein JCM10207_004124 [Rhodosporidiobolus poonsookiae]
MADHSQGAQQTKGHHVTLAPFTSHSDVAYSLQTRDPAALQAALGQIDKRAAALNAKPAPRGQPDLLLDYLQHHPSCEGVFAAWDLANKTNNSPLAASVLSCLASLVRLLSTDPFTPSPELIKVLLGAQYTPYLERSLNPGRNDVTTAALKLANVLVGFAGGRFARKTFGAFGWSPKITTRLFKTRLRTATSSTILTKPDIRTLLVLLVLGFLSASDVRLKSQVLETKGLLAGVFRGLAEDTEVVVGMVLETVYRELVLDRRVGLEARRNVFDEGTINELVKLYAYPLPAGEDPLPASHPTLSIHRFLRALSLWLSDQIASSPPGRSAGPQKVLGNVLKALKVTEEKEQRELGLEILERAPVLAGAFWAKFPSSLDPRLSSRWISAITFATRVVSLPVPLTLSPSLSSSPGSPAPPSLASVLDTILPPPTSSSLHRAWYTKSLTHPTPLVSLLSSLFLLANLQKAASVLQAIAATSAALEEDARGAWARLARRVREEVRARVPDPATVGGVMSRAAAAAGAGPAEEKGKKGRKSLVVEGDEGKKAGVDKDKEKDDTGAGTEGALLRTNVALRLLFLYHRVVPSTIASLKFDFARLPQTFSSPAPSSSPSSAAGHDEHNDQDKDKDAASPAALLSISSAYALRLAAAHAASTSTAASSSARPADHYNHVLAPLLRLYRTPATRSNRGLLQEVLRAQLDTPVLFGTTEGEVDTWVAALPVPQPGEDPEGPTAQQLEFWELAVQKTLLTPVKAQAAAALSSSGADAAFSPLLRTLLALLPTTPLTPALLSYLQHLFLAFLAASPTLAFPRRLLGAFKDALSVKGDEARKAVRGMKEALAVVEGGEAEGAAEGVEGKLEELLVEEEREELARGVVEGLQPRSGNVVLALQGKPELLSLALRALPAPLATLHVLAAPASLLPLATPALVGALTPTSAPSALHLALHRLISAPSLGVADLLVALAASPSEAFKARLAGAEGVRKVWDREDAPAEAYEAVARVVAGVFDPTSEADREAVRGVCEAVRRDLGSGSGGEKERKDGKSPKKKAKVAPTPTAAALPPRVVASAPLLPFFPAAFTLPLLSALLSSSTTTSTTSPALLDAAFARVLSLPPSTEFTSFWASHFSQLNALAVQGSASAAALLARGAAALLPFSPSSTPQRADALTLWRPHAAAWAAELLASAPLLPAQASALAALVYRSAAAREQLAEHLAGVDEPTTLLALGEPVRAAVEVAQATATEGEAKLPSDLAERFVRALLAAPAAASAVDLSSALQTAQLLAALSPSSASAARAVLDAHLSTLARDEYTAGVVRAVGALGGRETVETCVNACAEGLVRRFAEDEEDGEGVRGVVQALVEVVEKNDKLALKGHLLSPLVTAVATRRLDQPYAVELATALSKAHQFKDVEVTRHLNEIFASAPFLAFSAAPSSAEAVPTLSLILALSTSSASGAANARAAERLIPFYRGTLSAQDMALLALFQRIELALPVGQSVSPVLKGWNPSAAGEDGAATLLDGSRIAALGAASRPAVRRSWSRAFASTRTEYTPEDDQRTYDPRFVLGFVAALVQEDELKPQEWTTLLESGALGTVVAALASSEKSTRLVARATLGALLQKIEPLTFREKDELQLVLTQARLAVYSPTGEAIPASIALFLAHCTALLGQPDSALYQAFQRFLLQRATVDLRDVPMFYIMLYSSNTDEFAAEPREERRWMVRYLTEGLVRTQDWKIYRRRQVFELVASLFQASQGDAPLRKLILRFLVRATTIPTAARELLSRNGLLGWVAAQVPLDVDERKLLLDIVSNTVEVLGFDKLTGVADALEAVEVAVGSEVASVGTDKLLDLIRVIASRLPPPTSLTSSSLVPLILSRLSSLTSRIADSLDVSTAPNNALERFYLTVMALSFVRFEAGGKETAQDAQVWAKAVEAGMKAGVEQLKKEVLRAVCA